MHGGHVQGNLRGAGSFTTMTTMGVWVSGEMVSGGEAVVVDPSRHAEWY